MQTHAEDLVAYLAVVADWVTISDIEDNVNMPQSRITGLLKVLDVEGVVQRSRSRYRRSLQPWSFDAGRIDRVRQARLNEHDGMRRYATTTGFRLRAAVATTAPGTSTTTNSVPEKLRAPSATSETGP